MSTYPAQMILYQSIWEEKKKKRRWRSLDEPPVYHHLTTANSVLLWSFFNDELVFSFHTADSFHANLFTSHHCYLSVHLKPTWSCRCMMLIGWSPCALAAHKVSWATHRTEIVFSHSSGRAAACKLNIFYTWKGSKYRTFSMIMGLIEKSSLLVYILKRDTYLSFSRVCCRM